MANKCPQGGFLSLNFLLLWYAEDEEEEEATT
jgi:hypothetical protein